MSLPCRDNLSVQYMAAKRALILYTRPTVVSCSSTSAFFLPLFSLSNSQSAISQYLGLMMQRAQWKCGPCTADCYLVSGCYWGESLSANGGAPRAPRGRPPPLPFIRAGPCCLFNSFICRNDCDYQSRAHRLTEEVKVAPRGDKPQKTILHAYMISRAHRMSGSIAGFLAS